MVVKYDTAFGIFKFLVVDLSIKLSITRSVKRPCMAILGMLVHLPIVTNRICLISHVVFVSYVPNDIGQAKDQGSHRPSEMKSEPHNYIGEQKNGQQATNNEFSRRKHSALNKNFDIHPLHHFRMMTTFPGSICPIVRHTLPIDGPVTGVLLKTVANFQRTILFNVLGTLP